MIIEGWTTTPGALRPAEKRPRIARRVRVATAPARAGIPGQRTHRTPNGLAGPQDCLVDASVLAALHEPEPDANVVRWFARQPRQSLHLSVLTLGELRHGIEAMAETSTRQARQRWLEMELPVWFARRLLPVDAAIADRWGRLAAHAALAQAQPEDLPSDIEGLLAATALHHGLRIATRFPTAFAGLGVGLVNPWRG